jgi:hypothetical protein
MLKDVGVLALLLVLAGGCERNLYHYHRTVIGVDISGNVAGNAPSGHLTLGYSRRLVLVLPDEIKDALKDATPPDDNTQDKDKKATQRTTSESLPPTVFCTQVRASLGGVNSFREILATGTSAERYALSLVAASNGVHDWAYRNYVCPGFEIPAPKPSDPGAADNPQGVIAPVGALPMK